jgi:hypothetical protein
MKVHQITEEPSFDIGDRIDPPPLKGIGTTLDSLESVDIKPGILDSKGNRMFNVVDQNGKTLKKFSGPNAEADANEHRDKLNKQIKAAKPKNPKPKLTGDPKIDLKLKPDTGPASKLTGLLGRWIKDFFANTWIGKFLMKGVAAPIGVALVTAFNTIKLEEALDGYYRALRNHGLDPSDNCNVANSIDLVNGKAPSDLLRAYKNCVQTASEILIEIVLGALFGGLSIGVTIAVLSALGIASAGLSIVAGLIIGGAFVAGGSQLTYEIARAIGLIDIIDGYMAEAFSWTTMCRIARVADAAQDMSYGLLGDSTVIENKNFNKKSNSAVIKDLKAIIQSDPKLIAAFNKGKPKVKQVMSKAMSKAKED